MKLRFRKLKAEEIEIHTARINSGGVRLLLYKSSQADQNILDETVGPMAWQRQHSLNNANCTVAIWDDERKQWVSKEDTGAVEDPRNTKGLASDSFKRACSNWGIGRELYTAPDIFIPKEKLHGFKYDNAGNLVCYDFFSVSDVAYDECGNITSVTVQISQYRGRTPYAEMVFTHTAAKEDIPENTGADTYKTQTDTVPSANIYNIQTPKIPATAPAAPATTDVLQDNEKLLVGNCRGKTYGEIKDTEAFHSFLRWAKTAPARTYESDVQNVQFKKILKLAGTA